MTGSIVEEIGRIRERIQAACLRVGRDPAEVQLIAVTKTVSPERIVQAVEAGVTLLGENRVQELVDKHPQIAGVQWHLIGHLQSNKVKYIYEKVALIHSLDRLSLAEDLNRSGERLGRPINTLVQVNVAREESKYGLTVEEVVPFLHRIAPMKGIRVCGLMTIGPLGSVGEGVRPVFRELRELAESIKGLNLPGVSMNELSMGMTDDFEIAIEEGATLVRVGSGIFGHR